MAASTIKELKATAPTFFQEMPDSFFGSTFGVACLSVRFILTVIKPRLVVINYIILHLIIQNLLQPVNKFLSKDIFKLKI